MRLSQLKLTLLKQLAQQSEDEFKQWEIQTNNGRKFGTLEPLTPQDIFRYAFSKGATTILDRIDDDTKVADL